MGGSEGYSRLYYQSVDHLRRDLSVLKVGLAILMFLIPVWVIVVTASVLPVRDQVDAMRNNTLLGVAWLIALPFLLGALGWLVYVLSSGNRLPVSRIHEMAAYLLVAPARPFTGEQRGLAYKELGQLRQVAEVEQEAASWRGHFLLVGLFILLVACLGLLSFWLLLTRNEHYFLASLPPLLQSAGSLGRSVLLLVLFVGVVQLARYAFDFLTTESANRALLLACEEALALLEAHQLQQWRLFNRYEKRWLVTHLGYRFVVTSEASFLFEDEEGRRWQLVSLEGRPTSTLSQTVLQIADATRRHLIQRR